MKIKVKDSGWISYHELCSQSIYEVEEVIPFDGVGGVDYSDFQVVFTHPDHVGRNFRSTLWDESVKIIEGSIDEYK